MGFDSGGMGGLEGRNCTSDENHGGNISGSFLILKNGKADSAALKRESADHAPASVHAR